MKNSITKYISKLSLLFFLLLTVFSNVLNAQSDSKGKDFWLMYNTNYGAPALTLFITSDVNTTGTISGATFTSISFSVTANTVTAVSMPTALHTHTSDVIDNKGIHIVSNDEVTVYGLNRSSATTDAYLGYPTDVLGTNYMILTYKNVNIVNAVQLGIVATQDNTTITITPSVTTGIRTAGTPYSITMNQGQSYQLVNNASSPADLTGTTISSDKPVGVFGSHQCANIPQGYTYCDHICEMLPPTTTFGTRFGTVPLKSRVNGDTWRFMASEDNTVITINGIPQTAINKGAYVETILSSQSFITSDKPILAAQFANGSSYSGNPGDPFFMLVPPLEQFLAGYTLTTVAGFVTHYVNLVVPNSITSSVIMDGSALSSSVFTPIGSSGFSGAQITVADGSHTFTAPLPFGAFQYGFNTDDSYGYPGGQSFSPVATVSSLVIDFQSSTNAIGTNTCISAHVLDQFNANVEGVRVDFSSQGVNGTIATFDYTDANGLAEFCMTGNIVGVDTVVASVGNVKDTSYLTWTCNAPVFVSCPSNINVNASVATVVNYTAESAGDPIPTQNYVLSGATTGSGSGTGSGTSFNPGVTNVTVYSVNACGSDSCKFTITIQTQGCGAGTPTGPNVFSGNKTISTQTQMNAFFNSGNGNKYTKVTGNLTINGNNSQDPITNMCNLSELTEVSGYLLIQQFTKAGNPSNLADLAKLNRAGRLTVITCPQFLSVEFPELTEVVGSLNVRNNRHVRSILMPKLATMGGELLMFNRNHRLETLRLSDQASSFTMTHATNANVDIQNNGDSTGNALTMDFNKLSDISNSFTFSNNKNSGVTNFDNIFMDINMIGGNMIITGNTYLNKCCLASYATVSGSKTISGNTGNCADLAAVDADCGSLSKKQRTTRKYSNTDLFSQLSIYPSPNKGRFEVELTTIQTGILNITVTDLMGRTVLTQSQEVTGTVAVPVNMDKATAGQYILKLELNGNVVVKRVQVVK